MVINSFPENQNFELVHVEVFADDKPNETQPEGKKTL